MRILWILACLTIALGSPAESALRAASPMAGDGVPRTGAAGPQGPAGPVGEAGAKGEVGQKGDKGETGSAGAAGQAGTQGPQGVPGKDGQSVVGPPGPIGPAGPPGQTIVGPQGPAGASITGPTGAIGPASVPKRVERYTANANASGLVTYTWAACATTPDVDIIPTWSGDTMITGGVTAQTLSSATVLAKRSRGTLLLTSGPFETATPNAAMSTVAVTIRVICN